MLACLQAVKQIVMGVATITLKSSKKAVDDVVIYAQYATSGEEKSEAVNFIANINTAKNKNSHIRWSGS
ncbi:hypothetical protein ARSQ2_02481 [Arsenophonus endosymbiont of Bemisia tabaci Q2]|nr:hypothetical protein ARSQ2_02481 [Arsenophonus endosymbiont of Bemisia tabaci Q2]